MRLLIIFFLITSVFGNAKKDMYYLYKNKNYIEACNLGLKNFINFKHDEDYISLYAFSCLKADYIDRLAIPITKLKQTKQSRANASYFSIVLMQKKLLYYAMVDGYSLSKFNFPTTNHVISKVFDMYVKRKKDKKKPYYLFKDKNNNLLSYKLYLLKGKGLSKIVIEEIYDNKVIKVHKYW